ncbi:MAG: metallophosphoesterase family protein [Thermodesulfobacteriota bacterium]
MRNLIACKNWWGRILVVLCLAVLLVPLCEFVFAAEPDLPVVVPDLPPGKGDIRNRITIEQLRNIQSSESPDQGLAIDLGDAAIHGKIYTGPYPFAAGEADYDYPRYRLQGSLTGGKGVLPVAEFFREKINANHWPEGRSPVTPTVGYRLGLWRSQADRYEHLGFYDGVVSFRKEGKAILKNLTIVEGPFVARVTSDDPGSLLIVWETDEACRGQVFVWPDDGGGGATAAPAARSTRVVDDALLAKARRFTGKDAERNHRVTITGLQASTRYLYMVQCETARRDRVRSGLYGFRTAPRAGKGAVTLAVTGDSREGTGGGERNYMGVNLHTMSWIAADAHRRGAELLLFAGDLSNGYTSDVEDFRLQHKAWKQAVSGFWRTKPVYPCMGNHESLVNVYQDRAKWGIALDKWPYHSQSGEAIFSREFPNPGADLKPSDPRRPPYEGNVYRFQFGPLLILAFNNDYWWTTERVVSAYGGSPKGYVMEDQLQWIEQVLELAESNSTVKSILLYGHQPVFPCAGHVKDAMWWNGDNRIRAYTKRGNIVVPEKLGMIEVRNRLWRAVSRSSKVAAVITSHEHVYHRTLITRQTPVGVFPRDDTNGDGVLDSYSPDPSFIHPTWHITVGTAGAPYYAREKTPWEPQVLSSQEGYALLSIDGEKISLQFISITGQVVDRVDDLMEVKKSQGQQ